MSQPALKDSLLESGTTAFRGRVNMTLKQTEAWRPPLFSPAQTRISRWQAALRRYFDIQAASGWRDLSAVLPKLAGTLLDVGCGAQPFRILLNPAVHYVGIDTEEAKVHFGYEVPNTIYFSGDTWPVENDSVDSVLCTETLEHVFDTRIFVAQAARVLKTGGNLLLTVPFSARWHFIPHDYWRFTPSSLRLLLEEQGFDRVRVYARGNACTVACYKWMALLLRLLIPQNAKGGIKLLLRSIGTLTVPIFILLAVVANLSLRGEGGDDCLGYTAFAVRSARVNGAGSL